MRDNRKTDIIEALKWVVTAEEPIDIDAKQIISKTYKEPDYMGFSLSEINEAKELLVDKLFSGQIDFKAEDLEIKSQIKAFFLLGSLNQVDYKSLFKTEGYIKNSCDEFFYSMFFKNRKNKCRNILNKSEYYCFNWKKGIVATKNILLPQNFLENKLINGLLKNKNHIGFIPLIISLIFLLRNMDNLNFKYIYTGFASLFFLLITVLFPYRNAYKILIDIDSLKQAIPAKKTIAQQREYKANQEANQNIKEIAEITKYLTFQFDSFFNDFQKKHENILSQIKVFDCDPNNLLKEIQELVSINYESLKLEKQTGSAFYVCSNMEPMTLEILEATIYFLQKINRKNKTERKDEIGIFVNDFIKENKNNIKKKTKNMVDSFVAEYIKKQFSGKIKGSKISQRIKALIDDEKIY
ncbi:MAG: hypothetical protein AB7U85_07405 [Alphaproteobacteria bacterium]